MERTMTPGEMLPAIEEPDPPIATIEIRAPWGNFSPSRDRKYRLRVAFPDGIEPEHLGKIQRIADAAKRAAEGEELMAEPRVFSEVRSIRAMIEGDYETPGILQRLADLRPAPEPHNFVGRKDRACRACGKTFERGAHVIGVPAKGGRK